MDKQDILEKSRKENKAADEMERSVLAEAGKLAAGIGGLVCMVIALLQTIVTGELGFESWMIYCSIEGTIFATKAAKLHRKSDLWMAIIFIFLFAAFSVLFVCKLWVKS